MRHYSLYPTISDLDSSLGQADPVFPTNIYSAAPRDPYKAAAELGMTLPPRPAGLSAKEIRGWDALARVDIISERLKRAYLALLRVHTLTGSAICADLIRFNAASLRLHGAQQTALNVTRSAGIAAVPPSVPPPMLFTDVAKVCTSPTQLVTLGPGGAGVSPGICPGPISLEGVFIVLGITTIAALAIYGGIKAICSAYVDVEKAEEITIQASIESRFLQLRAELLAERSEACVKEGGDPVACLKAADAALPRELKALEAMRRDAGKPWYRRWYVWVGVGTGAIAATVLVVKLRK